MESACCRSLQVMAETDLALVDSDQLSEGFFAELFRKARLEDMACFRSMETVHYTVCTRIQLASIVLLFCSNVS